MTDAKLREKGIDRAELLSLRARGPANPCSSSCRINPVVTTISPPSRAWRSTFTSGAPEGSSRLNASDQTLVSTNRLTGTSVPPCSQRTYPTRAAHQLDQALLPATGDESSSARVMAAFLVFSPLTSMARSISLGSRERLVATWNLLHSKSRGVAHYFEKVALEATFAQIARRPSE